MEMESPDRDLPLPPDAPPVTPGSQTGRPVGDSKWDHRLYALAAATLAMLVFCLVWRPAAWIGLSAATVSLGALFVYYYSTRVQLAFIEFIAMIVALSQTIGLTTSVLWPQLRGTNQDWMILAVWLMEAGWILCGTLWASWVARHIGLKLLRQRLLVMLLAWLTPLALPGFFLCLGLSVVGIPSWLSHVIQQDEDCAFTWPVLFALPGAIICVWVMRVAWILHCSARMADSADRVEEKVVLPRAFTMNLKKSATPEVLSLDDEDPGTGAEAGGAPTDPERSPPES